MMDCSAGNLCFALAIRTKASGNSVYLALYGVSAQGEARMKGVTEGMWIR